MNKIGILLDCICDVVEDDKMTWREKKADIIRRVAQNGRIETCWQEFMSWFEEEFDEGEGE